VVGNLESLLRLVPSIVEAMIARKSRTFVEAADAAQYIPLIRAEKQAVVSSLAREAERQSNGRFSVREIATSFFHDTKFRIAALHIVLCSTRYQRLGERYVSVPAADELLYVVVVSTSPRQGLLVARASLKKKKKR